MALSNVPLCPAHHVPNTYYFPPQRNAEPAPWYRTPALLSPVWGIRRDGRGRYHPTELRPDLRVCYRRMLFMRWLAAQGKVGG